MNSCLTCNKILEYGHYGYPDMCYECSKEWDEEERRKRRCPLCTDLSNNEDLDMLRFHLDMLHSKEELRDFIIEGVQDNWD